MVPDDIRAVPRPKNTVVIDSGSNGLRRYAVRSRNGYVYNEKSGRNVPVNGKVIGYIFNGAFHLSQSINGPVNSFDRTSLVGYGAVRLIAEEGQRVEAALSKVYEPEDVQTIMAAAALRILRPRLPLNRYRSLYLSSWVSRFWPYASVSGNAISDFLNKLGHRPDLFGQVYAERLAQVAPDSLIMIDGFLKQDTSIVNTFSKASYKTALKGHNEISVLYAYDYELKDLLCSQVFPGNTLDANAFSTFVSETGIKRGILVADKGFPRKQIDHLLKANPDLHYILPLKRNSKVITSLELLKYTQCVDRSDRRILANKVKVTDHLFYYAFKDLGRSELERKHDYEQLRKGKLSLAEFLKRDVNFGTITFESDLDFTVEVILDNYDSRWELEHIFDDYKNNLDLDQTQVQGDSSVLGNEFINFIAASIQWKIAKRFDVINDQLGFISYKERMAMLYDTHRLANAPLNQASSDDGTWTSLNVQTDQAHQLMVQLGIAEPSAASLLVTPSKGPGRPKGSLNKTTLERMAKEAEAKANGTYEPPVKRKPGRPKGSLNKSTLERMAKEAEAKANGTYEPPVKRKPGRPKGSLNKSTLERMAKEAEAKANGTYEPPVKRKPGRPKGSLNKSTLERMAKEAEAKANGTYEPPVKRKPGRPKGSLNKSTLERMAKEAEAKANGTYEPPVKRKPGRPKGSLNKSTLERMAKEAEAHAFASDVPASTQQAVSPKARRNNASKGQVPPKVEAHAAASDVPASTQQAVPPKGRRNNASKGQVPPEVEAHAAASDVPASTQQAVPPKGHRNNASKGQVPPEVEAHASVSDVPASTQQAVPPKGRRNNASKGQVPPKVETHAAASDVPAYTQQAEPPKARRNNASKGQVPPEVETHAVASDVPAYTQQAVPPKGRRNNASKGQVPPEVETHAAASDVLASMQQSEPLKGRRKSTS